MWVDPKPDQEQYFEDINGQTSDPYARFDKAEARKRTGIVYERTRPLMDYLDARLPKISAKHQVPEHLVAINANYTGEDSMQDIVDYVFINSVAGHIMGLHEAALLGGIDSWPIAKTLFDCYETGGIPTGWIGLLPDKGGIPDECMQLLHFGPQAKT